MCIRDSPYPTASKSFLCSNVFMAKSGAQSLTFKSVTDRQTGRQTNKKSQRFWPPRRPGGGWNPSATKLGMVIEDLEHVLAPQNLLQVRRIVSPLRGAQNLGVTRPRQLKTPITETGYKFCKFYENRARGTPLRGVGHLYSTFLSNLSKNFSFGDPIP